MPVDVVLAASGLEDEFLDRARVGGQELDAVRIQRTLRLLEEALSQSDLVPSFESIRQGGAGRS